MTLTYYTSTAPPASFTSSHLLSPHKPPYLLTHFVLIGKTKVPQFEAAQTDPATCIRHECTHITELIKPTLQLIDSTAKNLICEVDRYFSIKVKDCHNATLLRHLVAKETNTHSRLLPLSSQNYWQSLLSGTTHKLPVKIWLGESLGKLRPCCVFSLFEEAHWQSNYAWGYLWTSYTDISRKTIHLNYSKHFD